MDAGLVEPDELQGLLEAGAVTLIDCSWYIPEASRTGRGEYELGHILGARFFDLDAASDAASPYVNMLPTPGRFAQVVGALGIRNGDSVVVYDRTYVSARVWWMFRLFGHRNVRILNGGLRRWVAEGRPVEHGAASQVAPAVYEARAPGLDGPVTWQEMLEAIDKHSHAIVDARTRERFTGELPSGYPGVPGGHMPTAVNVPWSRMIRQEGDFSFVSPEEARERFTSAGVDLGKDAILTCGSAVTAAVLAFQMQRIGKTNWRIYDGSWHEWAQMPALPKETG